MCPSKVAAVLVCAVSADVASAGWDPVPSVNLTALSTSAFSDSELLSRQFVDTTLDTTAHDLPFLLANFKRMADSVNELAFTAVNSGGTQTIQPGWINLDVWRATPGDYYNARSQENVAAFAYFYTANRSWNPYVGNTAVRQRLEAILTRWVTTTAADATAYANSSGQFSEGTFSSNSKNFNLAATAFGTKFMGQTLTYLSQPGVVLTPGLLDQVAAADRRALLYCLNSNSYFNTAFKNQYENVFCGALAYLNLHPEDTALRDAFLSRYTASATSFQSPAGYPYESGASDFSYNLGTHGYNQQLINTYTHGATSGYLKTVGDQAAAEEGKFYDWLSYNAVPLPGGGYLLNAGVATRRALATMTPAPNSFAETVPLIRAFVPTSEELAAEVEARRAMPVSAVAPLAVGDFYAYTPYDVVQRDWYTWNPTTAQREAAVSLLPYVASDRFTEQRVDTTTSPRQVYTFVRRPGYYAAFNAGDQVASQQRFGLGLLWHPEMGAVLQTLPGDNSLAWGTVAGGSLAENGDLSPTYRVGGSLVTPASGATRLGDGDLLVSYNLPSSRGTKSVLFADDGIHVSVSLTSSTSTLTEQFPLLLLEDDALVETVSDSSHLVYELRRGDEVLLLDFLGTNLGSTVVASSADDAGPYGHSLLSVSSRGSLSYTISVVPEPAGVSVFPAAFGVMARRRKRGSAGA